MTYFCLSLSNVYLSGSKFMLTFLLLYYYYYYPLLGVMVKSCLALYPEPLFCDEVLCTSHFLFSPHCVIMILFIRMLLCYFSVSLSSKLIWWGQGLCLFAYSLLLPQHLWQCLVLSGHSGSVGWLLLCVRHLVLVEFTVLWGRHTDTFIIQCK